MKRSDILRLKERTKQRYREDMAAFDRVLAIYDGGSKSTFNGEPDIEKKPTTATAVIREIINAKVTDFTATEVMGEFNKAKPEGMGPIRKLYLALFLRRMVDKDLMIVTKQGKGRRENTYKRTGPLK